MFFRDILAVFLFYGGEKMANWTCSLFKEDLYSKDFIELADWLEACRNYVKPEYCNSEEDYLYSLSKPSCLENPKLCGVWKIIEDPKGIIKENLEN